MLTSEKIESIIFTALQSLNEELSDKKIELASHTVLFGKGADIDSLALVSVVVDVETALNSDYDYGISLTDDRAMTRAISPFETVATLRDYIFELVTEHDSKGNA